MHLGEAVERLGRGGRIGVAAEDLVVGVEGDLVGVGVGGDLGEAEEAAAFLLLQPVDAAVDVVGGAIVVGFEVEPGEELAVGAVERVATHGPLRRPDARLQHVAAAFGKAGQPVLHERELPLVLVEQGEVLLIARSCSPVRL